MQSICVAVGAVGGSKSRWNSGGNCACLEDGRLGGVLGGETAKRLQNPPIGVLIAVPKREPATLCVFGESRKWGRTDMLARDGC